MCIRDRWLPHFLLMASASLPEGAPPPFGFMQFQKNVWFHTCCLLYTSPSPRDGHLSIPSAASDVYKRQVAAPLLVDGIGQFAGRSAAAFRLHAVPEKRVVPHLLSLIHISEPTRRTPLYSVGSVRCV